MSLVVGKKLRGSPKSATLVANHGCNISKQSFKAEDFRKR